MKIVMEEFKPVPSEKFELEKSTNKFNKFNNKRFSSLPVMK